MAKRTEKTEHVHFVAPLTKLDIIDRYHKGHGSRTKAMNLALSRYADYLESKDSIHFRKALEEIG